MSQTSFFSSRPIRVVALFILFSVALAIRLYDLTDLPLDFHPTRQLLSAIKARALYFQTQPDGISTEELEMGIRQAKLKAQVEPVIFERVVAFTYRFTGEKLWIARIYSSLFWLIGGVFLFLVVHDLVSFDGAIFSTAYYLFFPYAIIASRSFQPDPLMVTLILAFWWLFSRWVRFPSWLNALLAGLIGGLAIFIKLSAVFFVIGAALGLAPSRYAWRDVLRNGQVWAIAILGALPGMLYLIYGLFIEGGLGSQFSGRFVPSLLLSPLNYLGWMTKVDKAAGGIFVMLALLGFFVTTDKRLRTFMFGLWGGYLLYSLFFDYHSATHDYYQLPFIPMVAVSLSPLGEWFFARLTEATVQGAQRTIAYLILIVGMFMVIWNVRNQMKAVDYRPQAVMWAQIGQAIQDKSVIALIQDYGARLEYWGRRNVPTWPYTGDLAAKNLRNGKFSFDEFFADYSSKKEFFLVTDFDELNNQPQLKARLQSFPVFAEGDGYKIFDLRKP
ncbi:MAG TPA: glycosyltransferase family 39 protein [Anaerolineales bacterium]|nr:glycosyltransferase family 39 protein [Anaerolineales bacterium]